MLYDESGELTNWPGSLRIRPHYCTIGRHNWAGKRFDLWFYLNGHDGQHYYHAVRFGNNTQIAHVQRVKSR